MLTQQLSTTDQMMDGQTKMLKDAGRDLVRSCLARPKDGGILSITVAAIKVGYFCHENDIHIKGAEDCAYLVE